MPDYEIDNTRAESSIKSLNFELTNLTPSALITLFEIDISKLVKSKNTTLAAEQQELNAQFKQNNITKRIDLNDNILRFHNNVNIFNSYIVWQGKVYHPAPIAAEGFEATTKGTLPQPTLSISSQSENGIDQLALLKHEIRKFGDIIGSTVTRRRTFAKYLDKTNFTLFSGANLSEKSQQIPQGYEPDPFAELPKDVYFIERKQTENKSIITYQLSSILDLEGTKIPKRVINSDKCVWQYRGIGCWYQHATEAEEAQWNTNFSAGVPSPGDAVPILKKAELDSLHVAAGATVTKAQGTGLPERTLPVANDKDERLSIAGGNDRGLWQKNPVNSSGQPSGYMKGQWVFLEKDDIKYYFVCIKDNGAPQSDAILPPNSDYWEADECSKTLTGCRMRWGSTKGKVVLGSKCALGKDSDGSAGVKGLLPFGGFPAARKIQRQG
jgi:lambda family phage minor tail protein L